MKRLFYTFFVMLIMGGFLIPQTMAANYTTDYTVYYEDGSYAIITLDNDWKMHSNANTYRTYTYYDPLGQRCFAYTLNASFTYNGVTSNADSCDYKAIIYRQGWDIASHSEYVSGNTAYGNATFTGPNGQVRTASLTLTCDKNGNVT